MRIQDEASRKELTSVLIMLTPQEAHELAGKLKTLDSTMGDHIHISDLDFTREITLAVYTPENLRFFSEEVRRLVEE